MTIVSNDGCLRFQKLQQFDTIEGSHRNLLLLTNWYDRAFRLRSREDIKTRPLSSKPYDVRPIGNPAVVQHIFGLGADALKRE